MTFTANVIKTNTNFQGWRACYYITGVIALLVAVLLGLTLKEPERKSIGSAKQTGKVSLMKVLLEPRVVMLMIAASIRHCGGMTFAYNVSIWNNSYFYLY